MVSVASNLSRPGRRACVTPALGPFNVTGFRSCAHVPSCRTVAALSVFVLCVTRSGRQRGKRYLGPLFFCDGHFHIISSYSEPGQTFIGLPGGPISSIPFPSHVCLLAKTFSTSPPLDPLTPDIHLIHSINRTQFSLSRGLVFFLRPPASSISSKEVYRMFHNYSQDSLELTQPETCFVGSPIPSAVLFRSVPVLVLVAGSLRIDVIALPLECPRELILDPRYLQVGS